MARDKIVAFGVAEESFEPLKEFAQTQGGWKGAVLKGLALLANEERPNQANHIRAIVVAELAGTRTGKSKALAEQMASKADRENEAATSATQPPDDVEPSNEPGKDEDEHLSPEEADSMADAVLEHNPDLADALKNAPPIVRDAYPDEAKVKAIPLARKLAADLHVDLAKVKGTGRNGLILAEDVRQAAGKQTA